MTRRSRDRDSILCIALASQGADGSHDCSDSGAIIEYGIRAELLREDPVGGRVIERALCGGSVRSASIGMPVLLDLTAVWALRLSSMCFRFG